MDGVAAGRLVLPPTANWDTWALASVPLDLTAGRHEIALVRTAADSGNVNLDSLAVLAPGAAYPAPVPPGPQPCAFGAVCEADTGTLAAAARASPTTTTVTPATVSWPASRRRQRLPL